MEQNIKFDDVKSGINSMERDNRQLSLFDTNIEIELPTIPKELERHKKSKKSTKQTKIDLDKIKTLQPKKQFESNGIGVVHITGVKSASNTLVSHVSEKGKKELEDRNKELLRLREHPYIKKGYILTEAEKKLYRFLRTRLAKDIIIFSKVRLADIVELNEAVTRDSKAFRMIAYKHVDFAIMSPNLDLICIVELDDYTHETSKAKERDNFVRTVMQECNIPFYRIGTKIDLITKEDTRFIELCVLEYMAPTCPICGRPMEPKESKNKYNYGHRFYGCMGFYEQGDKKCSYTIDID